MRPRVAIIAALPLELRGLVRGWSHRRYDAPHGYDIFQSDQAVAVCAGMGSARAAYAARIAAASGPCVAMISAGYAGALQPVFAPETVHWCREVLDRGTGERFFTADAGTALLTVDRVLHPQEKLAAGKETGAGLADMEAAAVARVSQELGVPFRTVKAVTDSVEEALPDVSAFVNGLGEFEQWAYTRYLLLRPWMFPFALRMGRRSAMCSRLLAQELQRTIAVSRC